MEMEEEDEKDKETYVVEALGIVHATWRMVGFKMDGCCRLRVQEFTQDKTKRRRHKSLSITYQFGRGSLLSKINLNFLFQRPKHPFYNREGWSQMYKREGSLKGHLLIPSKTI